MLSSTFSLVCVWFSLTAAFTQAAVVVPRQNVGRITHFVTVGDSYTDNCNLWRRYNASLRERAQYPFPFCPPAPTGRSSGGQSWPEHIKLEQGQTIDTDATKGFTPLKPGQWNVTNFAQGGATCDNFRFTDPLVPDVGSQIGFIKTNYETTPPMTKIPSDPATTVAAMFIGTNDVGQFFLPNLLGLNPVAVEGDCIKRRLTALHDFGYRRILLFENINLGNLPMYSENGQENTQVQGFAQGNNRFQADLVRQLNAQWAADGTEILIFPTFDLFKRMYDNPTEYGFKDVTSYCKENNVRCQNPQDYMWYDYLHPGDGAERILARKVIRFLQDGARGDALIAGQS